MQFAKFAEVVIDRSIDKSLTYGIPENLEIELGHFVEVPLRSIKSSGIVIKIMHTSNQKNIQPICRIINEKQIPLDLLHLAFWMSQSYCAPLKDVLFTIFPCALRKKFSLTRTINSQDRFIRINVTDTFLIEWCQDNRYRKPSQARILDFLINNKKPKKIALILKEAQAQKAALNTLLKAKILKEVIIPSEEELLLKIPFLEQGPKTPSSDQFKIIHNLLKTFKEQPTSAHLLWGATGSDKTEIYIHVVKNVISGQKKAIVLVPEISLITQMAQLFRSRIHGRVAIFHSSLSQSIRQQLHQSIIKGEIDLLIGTRSAIFLPLSPLGVIILDDEHDTSYKSERSPAFHARDIAIKRAEVCRCPIILGSATPSLESFQAALENKYYLYQLPNKILDQKSEIIFVRRPKKGIFSPELIKQIKETASRGEQVLLFLNRRGYYEVAICQACNQPLRCPNCDLSLTVHIKKQILLCHICQYSTFYKQVQCSKCRKESIRFLGWGTERAETTLQKLLPNLRIMRIDRDQVTTSDELNDSLHLFRSGSIDVLIGTQMITKGHNFPLVTLIGILHPDQQLWNPDFRNGEFLVQTLTQVSGRVSREGLPGTVIIQTEQKDLPYYRYALAGEYEEFAKNELELRKRFLYPPFCSIIHFLFRHKDIEAVTHHANTFRHKLSETLQKKDLLSPCSKLYRFKTSGLYRLHFIVKTNNCHECSLRIKKLLPLINLPKGILKIDFHPISLS
ncbi:replication restart helicase PriA [Candidatus Similichlamydia epinepheli]|uniref:replication restart helicase PriA n=1 Tax=Candidatus Similichlamydia epinepheli TaxID=1903953 RepID=UPI000D3C7E50|nr:primosomal protein N' [Candidatus Similichlamydia epinepheli]